MRDTYRHRRGIQNAHARGIPMSRQMHATYVSNQTDAELWPASLFELRGLFGPFALAHINLSRTSGVVLCLLGLIFFFLFRAWIIATWHSKIRSLRVFNLPCKFSRVYVSDIVIGKYTDGRLMFEMFFYIVISTLRIPFECPTNLFSTYT